MNTFEVVAYALVFVGVMIALWIDSRGFND